MNLRTHAWVFLPVAAALAMLAGLAFWLGVFRTSRPNVLLITLDTTRADRLGCYGFAGARTPALDGLAREGVLFENAVSSVPLTLPSHATILTGLHPPEHGLHLNSAGALPADVPTLATVLKAHGYQTAAFIASPVLAAKFGLSRGFDVYDDAMPSAAQPAEENQRTRSGDDVAAAAGRWMEKSDTPFFCWVHFYDPHWPYDAHENLFGASFKDRPYDGEIAFVDLQVQRVLDAVERRGLLRRTVIVVAGDHGETLGGAHSEPRPHHGLMLYRDTMRVPLILAGPRIPAASRGVAQQVSLIDVFPSVLRLAGLRSLPPCSGRSVAEVFRGGGAPRPCYGESDLPGAYGWSVDRSLTTERWKYIRAPLRELYDLTADPGEATNLVEVRQSKADEMERELCALEDRMNERSAATVSLTASDRQQLKSLGYAAGGVEGAAHLDRRKDVKTMLPVLRRSMDGEELARRGDHAGAVAVWQEVATRSPETWIWRNALASALQDMGQAKEAIRTLQSLKEDMEEDQTVRVAANVSGERIYPIVLNNLAFVLFLERRYEEALPLAKEALSMEASRGAFHHTLAGIYRGLGDMASAEREARCAVELDGRPEHLILLGELCCDQGRTTEARAFVKQALQQAGPRDKQNALATLQRINAVPHPPSSDLR